ncbi:uncharacterized protein CTRU02_213217 [Colletotrichum truncatum]|uniref:Uncharacterized protein n=1 Tax=Colletotrichum truncatum TaxID=5467 RepID=A0ACC3YK75_COLTU|nr:uncharacterized protein CTRU02_12595 [Colletotrichum truncatum]KAF6784333.1 hypothetical protein CTRU02_12595 [Colletotrichum truncatum]
MKLITIATILTVVTAASAASVDVGLVKRQGDCATKGANCGGPGDRGCCAGTTCQNTRAPVGGVGMICQ